MDIKNANDETPSLRYNISVAKIGEVQNFCQRTSIINNITIKVLDTPVSFIGNAKVKLFNNRWSSVVIAFVLDRYFLNS